MSKSKETKTAHQKKTEQVLEKKGIKIPEHPTVPSRNRRTEMSREFLTLALTLAESLGCISEVYGKSVKTHASIEANLVGIGYRCSLLCIEVTRIMSECGIPDLELLKCVHGDMIEELKQKADDEETKDMVPTIIKIKKIIEDLLPKEE